LLQEDQPIAYASRALTETETRYAQIEKELLAIVWAPNKFDQYILGREMPIIHIHYDAIKLFRWNKKTHNKQTKK
jgi:hypothetical protein